METYPRAAVEQAMKIQKINMRAIAKKITCTQAGEILRLYQEQYEDFNVQHFQGEARRKAAHANVVRVDSLPGKKCRV
jgi:hypothetical protein